MKVYTDEELQAKIYEEKQILFKNDKEYFNYLNEHYDWDVWEDDCSIVIYYEFPEDTRLKLHLGYMSNKELAEWLEIKQRSFEKKKKKYLNYLKEYCEFEDVRGGVNITAITYELNKKGNAHRFAEQEMRSKWGSGLNSCSYVGRDIWFDHSEELNCEISTMVYHVRQVREERYGSPSKQTAGTEGECFYVKCAISKGRIYPLREEAELEEDKRLKREAFDNAEAEADIYELLITGDLSKEEAEAMQAKLRKESWGKYKKAFKERFGGEPILLTQLVDV